MKTTQDAAIAALATPHGVSAISLIRCSGENTLSIAEKIFQGKRLVRSLPSRRAELGWVADPDSNDRLDHVLLTVYRTPDSYTGEDMIEISTHGGTYVPLCVLDLLVRQGCRMARPGEFTRRAFLNGKVNLMQAEAVREIIASRTSEHRRMAIFQMAGGGAQPIMEIKEKLEYWLAKVEASIEFPDESDVEPWNGEEFKQGLWQIRESMQGVLQSCERGKRIRDGLRIPIVGQSNVGKSTLFNWLCREERVIVDAKPGTTRDSVEEELEIGGERILLADTAGIRSGAGGVEEKGILKTKERLAGADAVVWVRDITAPEEAEEEAWEEIAEDKPLLRVFNKADLAKDTTKRNGLVVSLKTGLGLSELGAALESTVRQCAGPSTSAMVSTVYETNSLKRAVQQIEDTLRRFESGEGRGEEILSIEIRDIMGCLESLTGVSTSEDTLDCIFNTFCVGK